MKLGLPAGPGRARSRAEHAPAQQTDARHQRPLGLPAGTPDLREPSRLRRTEATQAERQAEQQANARPATDRAARHAKKRGPRPARARQAQDRAEQQRHHERWMRRLAREAATLGATLWLHGGRLRDEALGYDATDTDLLMLGVPVDAAIALVRRSGAWAKMAPNFPVLRGVNAGTLIEISVVEDPQMPHQQWVDADIMKRDFTVNAAAAQITAAGRGGLRTHPQRSADLASRTLRLSGEAGATLAAHPAIPARALRFIATRGLKPHVSLTEGLRAHAHVLNGCGQRKIGDELLKALGGADWRVAASLLGPGPLIDALVPTGGAGLRPDADSGTLSIAAHWREGGVTQASASAWMSRVSWPGTVQQLILAQLSAGPWVISDHLMARLREGEKECGQWQDQWYGMQRRMRHLDVHGGAERPSGPSIPRGGKGKRRRTPRAGTG